MRVRHPRRSDLQSRGFPQPPIAPRLYRNIAMTFLGLTVVIVAVAIWMSSVKATVRIQVKRDLVKLDTVVEIAKSPADRQLQGRVVEGPFEKIQEFKVKAQVVSSQVTTTTGRVRIKNNYSKDQVLIKTTRLLTSDGKLFRINQTVTVPSGESIEVDAYSDKAGKEFEIKAGEKFTIPGLWIDLQSLITAEAITAFTPKVGAAKIVTEADITEAQQTLEQAVLEQAKGTLAAEALIPADKLADDCTEDSKCWTAVYVVNTIEKKTNVKAGQQSDTFLAQVKLKVTAVFYPKKDMETLVSGKLKEKLPEGRELVDFDPQRVNYRLEQVDIALEQARLTVMADAYSRLTAQSPDLAKEKIAGLSVLEAKSKLKSVEGANYVEITLRPSWARKIPRQKDKIDITIE